MPVAAGGVESDALRAERMRILESLLEDVDALADAGLAAIRAEIPAYAAQDERFLADVREQIGAHYRAKLQLLLEERPVTLDDISFVRGAATRRARAGFALEDYLSAYRVGQQVLWDVLVERGSASPEGAQAALSLATPMMRYSNFVSARAARAYVEFEQYVVVEADRERRDLLEHLLAGELPLLGPLHAAAQAYGLAADARTAVAVAVPAGPEVDADAPHAAGVALARAGLSEGKTLVVVRQAEIVAVLPIAPDRDERDLCDRLEAVQDRLSQEGLPLSIGVSTVAHGAAELPRAYSEARAALECATLDGGLAALPRLSPFAYLAARADDTARRLVDAPLRAFLDEDRERGSVLTETIRAFAAADLNLRVAAERLQVHPNTAQYRISRIEERTGRNPRHIADLLDLLTAIALDDARR